MDIEVAFEEATMVAVEAEEVEIMAGDGVSQEVQQPFSSWTLKIWDKCMFLR